MDTLKPCPFCGGEPTVQQGFGYRITCSRCGVYKQKMERDATIEQWNTRHTEMSAADRAIVEAVRRWIDDPDRYVDELLVDLHAIKTQIKEQ